MKAKTKVVERIITVLGIARKPLHFKEVAERAEVSPDAALKVIRTLLAAGIVYQAEKTITKKDVGVYGIRSVCKG